jgi:hypothetical protein
MNNFCESWCRPVDRDCIFGFNSGIVNLKIIIRHILSWKRVRSILIHWKCNMIKILVESVIFGFKQIVDKTKILGHVILKCLVKLFWSNTMSKVIWSISGPCFTQSSKIFKYSLSWLCIWFNTWIGYK